VAIVQSLRYEPLTDPGDPDDYRPNSALAFVIDPGDDSGACVRDLSLIFERIAPGDRIPLHRHPSDEAIVIEAGAAEVTVGEDLRQVGPGTVVFIPRGVPHRTRNTGAQDLRWHAAFPSEVIAIDYLDRNPAPGTEADPPRPPWWIDLRETLGP
jgi:hypothetical protein